MSECISQDNVISVVTWYGQDGMRIESWLGTDFPHLSRLALGSAQPPVHWVPCLFPRGRVAGAW